MMALFKAANGLRKQYPSLRRGEVSGSCGPAPEYNFCL
jgi:hypothetical protein